MRYPRQRPRARPKPPTSKQKISSKFNSILAFAIHDEKGSTAVEYAMIGTGIGLSILGIVWALGDEISLMFKNIQETFSNVQIPSG